MNKVVDRFLRGDEGQDLIEYVLLAALVALAAATSMSALVAGANGIFTIVYDAVTGGS